MELMSLMIKKILSVLTVLSVIISLVPVYAEGSGWSIDSGDAVLTQTRSGIEIEYSSGKPVLKYQLSDYLADIVSVEFDCSLNAARINTFKAFSDKGINTFYVKSSKNMWAINGKNGADAWNEVSLGYDISEYSRSSYRYIINNTENTYSLYVDGRELIKDYRFLNDESSVGSIRFTFEVPFDGKTAKAYIDNMTVKNVTKDELEKEEFGEAIEEKAGTEENIEIYLSPNGDDSFNGSFEKPLKTLTAAKAFIKTIKQEKGMPVNGIDVVLRGGKYRISDTVKFDLSDSGMENSRIRYRAYPGEKVSIVGSKEIDSALFEKVIDEEICKRLPNSANVWELNLERAGLKDEIEIPALGQVGKLNAGSSEILVNGRSLSAARWPNTGYAMVESITDDGAVTVGYETIANWQDLSHAWMHGWSTGWYDGSTRVSYDEVSGGLKKRNDLPHGGITEGDKIYFVNILEELDREGEWYINPETNMLYVWLPDNPENCKVEISTQKKDLIKLSGTKYIEFLNIDFSECRGDAFALKECTGIKFIGCEFKNIGRKAITLEECEKCIVKSCDISMIGKGGISLSGGDKETLTKAENYVVNTHISDFSRETKTSAPAVNVSGVGNYVLNNQINGGENTAIFFDGNFNVIDRNEIYAVLTESNDAGAIYAGRSFVDRGNIVSNNFIHTIENGSGNNRMAIYLDDHFSGTEVNGNIIYDCNVSVLLHGGRDNVVKNNFSVNTDKGITAIDWYYKDNLDEPNYSIWQGLDSSPYRTELWQSTFPKLINIRNDEPKEPKYNVISENLSVNCGIGDNAVENYRNYSTVENNVDTDDMTVIKSMDSFDFNINENSEAYKKYEFLKPNVYDEIGLFIDEYRTSFPKLGDIKPNLDERSNNGRVTFYWERVENASEYIFLLSEDRDFTKIIEQERIYGKNYISVSGLKDNGTKYYWKIRAVMNTSKLREEKESGIRSFTPEMKGGLIYNDDFDDGIVPNGYYIDDDVKSGISISDGMLIYERASAPIAAETGLYRDVDIDLSEIESSKLVVEYDLYPMNIESYCYNFPQITDTDGNMYINNYFDHNTKDLNSKGQQAKWHWHWFQPWNSGEAFVFKMKAVIDPEKNNQSLYAAQVPLGYDGEAEYIGYDSCKFSSANTDGRINRIYLARPEKYNNVKIGIDNFRVYKYKPLEIIEISKVNGAVLLSDTPTIDITFNSWLDDETLSNIKFKNGDNEVGFECIKNSNESISIKPDNPLIWGESYSLVIPQSVKNIYHQSIDKNMIYNYTVRENPAISDGVIISENFNDGNSDGMLYDSDSSEELKAEDGVIKYKKTNTYGVLTQGLRREVNIDMNKLPQKKLTIEYDLYPYEIRNDKVNWLYGFPEIVDENGKKYCSFYFEAPNTLVKYFTTSSARKIGDFFQGNNVMYRVELNIDYNSKKYTADFKWYNTVTGALENTVHTAEGAFPEETTGKIAYITLARGDKWCKFNIGIDNFMISSPDGDNVIYNIENSQNIAENTTYKLNGVVVNGSLTEFVTVVAEYDDDDRLVNSIIIDSKSYDDGVLNTEFTTNKDTVKIKIFTWKDLKQMKPISKIYELQYLSDCERR